MVVGVVVREEGRSLAVDVDTAVVGNVVAAAAAVVAVVAAAAVVVVAVVAAAGTAAGTVVPGIRVVVVEVEIQ